MASLQLVDPKAYRQTKAYKDSIIKYKKSEKGKRTKEMWENSERGKAWRKKYYTDVAKPKKKKSVKKNVDISSNVKRKMSFKLYYEQLAEKANEIKLNRILRKMNAVKQPMKVSRADGLA